MNEEDREEAAREELKQSLGVLQPDLVDSYGEAGWLSLLFFSWAGPMMSKAYREDISLSDVWLLPPGACAISAEERLRRGWAARRDGDGILRVLLIAFMPELLRGLIFTLIWGAFFVLGPAFLLPGILQYVGDPSIETWVGWVYGAGFVFAQLVSNIFYSQGWFLAMWFALNIRSACVAVAVSRALELQKGGANVGHISNFVSSDTERIFVFAHHLCFGSVSALVLVGITIALFFTIGYPTIIGLVLVLLSYPAQTLLARQATKVRNKIVPVTDKRVQLMSELITAMRLIKLYAWEKPFGAAVSALRLQEIVLLKKSGVLMSCTSAVTNLCFSLGLWGSLSLFIIVSGSRASSTVFVVLSLFGAMRFPLQLLNITQLWFGESVPSFTRLEEMLEPVRLSPKIPQSTKWLIEANDCAFGFLPEDDGPPPVAQLESVTFELRPGMLIAVVGAVGSGKSTLALGLMNGGCEALLGRGSLAVSGGISFAPQVPWILNATVKQNILFHFPLDKELYQNVTNWCQLSTDFKSLPYGDSTLIGERGVNLSGGQKQRVSLARAVYAAFASDRRIVVLDDVLSALDNRVQRLVFEVLIRDKLRAAGKGILLITHQLHVCSQCDEIIVLQQGRQVQRGSYEELMAQTGPFEVMMRDYVLDEEETENAPPPPMSPKSASLVSKTMKAHGAVLHRRLSGTFDEAGPDVPAQPSNAEAQTGTGSVSLHVWMFYFSLVGWGWFVVTILLTIAWVALRAFADYWLVFWVAGTVALSNIEFMWIWLIINVVFLVVFFLQIVAWVHGTMMGGSRLYDAVFEAILRGSMSFFEKTPNGRIISRLSKDVDNVDKSLPFSIDQFFQGGVQVLSFFIVIAVALPWFLIAIIPIFACFFALGAFFRASSRQLRRVDGQARSPLYSSLGEVLSGLVAIHSFQVEEIFHKLLLYHADRYHATVFAFWTTTRWFSVRLDLTTSLVVAVATIVSLSLREQPAFAGVALSYSLRVSALLQWTVRQFIESESHVTSVERLLDYAENIPMEAAAPNLKPPDGWISRGAIEFENVTVRYDGKHDPVLDRITFSVKAGERIGIVGRTGAGKSSLISAFFRLIELDAGRVVIDAVDVSRIALFDLRSQLSIIPQDPVLFQGTLRVNLDPFDQFSTEDLRAVVERVSLNLPLEDEIEQGGANVSVGQRQLICIARALLKRSKVLVLDEASASLSTREDIVLQRVLREDFRDATVLCIAHRLNTVIDCSRILVLDRGRVLEYDSPAELVQRQGSRFRSLIDDTGAASSRHLVSLALSSRLVMEIPHNDEIARDIEEDIPLQDRIIATEFAMTAKPLAGGTNDSKK